MSEGRSHENKISADLSAVYSTMKTLLLQPCGNIHQEKETKSVFNNHHLYQAGKHLYLKTNIKMVARRSVNNSHAKKPFIAKASDNRTSETHVLWVNTLIHSHTLWFHML